MISVAEALEHVFALVTPLDSETVPLRHAAGRVLAAPIEARHTQPPFAASAMDGYAVSGPAHPGSHFKVVGESAAGHGFFGKIDTHEAVRIFTGAPLPDGADRVIIQEDVARTADRITLGDNIDPKSYIRPAGFDFQSGDRHAPDRPLTPHDIALIAAMGHGHVSVRRQPQVALIATGDELVMPGSTPGPDQIIASNNLGLAALVEQIGARARVLPIARDTPEALNRAFDLARGADLILTIGGASVGDHDLVGTVAQNRGMERAFYKVAMRPGKPLMAGRLDGIPMIGLPGNPVSSMVCGIIFILPALLKMLGMGAKPMDRQTRTLAAPLSANGPREHYMRAVSGPGGVRAHDRQDSALLGVLAAADTLIVRPPHDAARAIGDPVDCIPLSL